MPSPETESGRDPNPRGEAVPTVRAEDILGSGDVARIDLDGEIYTLRRTRNHRLILTK